jgi:microcystin-dependent protein
MNTNCLLGSITLFAGDFAPKGWAFCEGQIMPIAQNSALFSLLGFMYGGDGKTTFALPDLRGRAPIHVGQGPGLNSYKQGQSGGSDTVTLTVAQLPPHNHSVKVMVTNQAATLDDPTGNILAKGQLDYGPLGLNAGQYGGVQETNVGNSQPVAVRSPFLALNYIIALQGIFPSR